MPSKELLIPYSPSSLGILVRKTEQNEECNAVLQFGSLCSFCFTCGKDLELFNYSSHLCDLSYLDDCEHSLKLDEINSTDDKMPSNDKAVEKLEHPHINTMNVEAKPEQIPNEAPTNNYLDSNKTININTDLTNDPTQSSIAVLKSNTTSNSIERISENGGSTVVILENRINGTMTEDSKDIIDDSELCNFKCKNPQKSYHHIDLTEDDVDIEKTIKLSTSSPVKYTHTSSVDKTTSVIDLTKDADVSAPLPMDKIVDVDGVQSDFANLSESAEQYRTGKLLTKENSECHNINSTDEASKTQSYVAHEEDDKPVDSAQQDIDDHFQSFQNDPSRSILCQLVNEDQQSSQDARLFVCYLCSKIFITKTSLKVHYGKKHKPSVLDKNLKSLEGKLRVKYKLSKSIKKTSGIAIPNLSANENPKCEGTKENNGNENIEKGDNIKLLQLAEVSESRLTHERDLGNVLSPEEFERTSNLSVIDKDSMTPKLTKEAKCSSVPTTSYENVYKPKKTCSGAGQRSDETIRITELNAAKANETKKYLGISKHGQNVSESNTDNNRHKVRQVKRKQKSAEKDGVKNKSVGTSKLCIKDQGISSYKNPSAKVEKRHRKIEKDTKLNKAAKQSSSAFQQSTPVESSKRNVCPIETSASQNRQHCVSINSSTPLIKDHLQISGITRVQARNKDLAKNSSVVNKTKSTSLPLTVDRIKNKDIQVGNVNPKNIFNVTEDAEIKEENRNRDKRDRSQKTQKLPIKDCDSLNINDFSSKKQKASSSKDYSNPKKFLTLEQYKQRRRFSAETSISVSNNAAPRSKMLSVLPKVKNCSESLNNDVALRERLTASDQEVRTRSPQSLEPNPIRNLPVYSPHEMDIIIEISQQISIHRKRMDSDTARFSDEPDTEEESPQLNREAIFCEACGLQTSSINFLQDHMKNMHRGFRFTCFVCDSKYGTVDELIRHQIKYSKSVLVFAESRFLRQRKSIPNQLYPYYCNLCGKGFTQMESIANHKRDEHKKGKSNAIQGIFKEPYMVIDPNISQESNRDGHESGQDLLVDDHTSDGKNRQDSCKNTDNDSPLDESNKSKCNSGRSTGSTDVPNPETVFEFCELCGEKHSCLADKQKHFHIKGFECVICHKTLEDLDSLAKHYDLCHPKHEIVNFELIESSIQKKYKFFCKFCGIGFHFINQVLDHKEVMHYELAHQRRFVEECTNHDRLNSEKIQTENVANLHEVGEDVAKSADSEIASTKAVENNDENLIVIVDQNSRDSISLDEIFKMPTNIPGLDVQDNDKNDEEDSNKTENQEIHSISECESVILNTCDSAVAESNQRVDLPTLSFDTDSSRDDLTTIDDSNRDDLTTIDLEDTSSRDSSGKDDSNYFMDVHEYLKEKNVDCFKPSVDHEEVETSSLSKELNQASIREDRGIFCEVCGRQFEDNASLALHDGKNHSPNYFECSLCNSSYPDITTLVQHQDENHRIKSLSDVDKSRLPEQDSTSRLPAYFRYYCSSCGQGDNYLNNMKFHKLNCPRKVSAASISEKSMDSEGSSNVSNNHSSFGPEASSDGTKAKNKSRCISANTSEKIICPICKERFQYWHQLNEHRVANCRFEGVLELSFKSSPENVAGDDQNSAELQRSSSDAREMQLTSNDCLQTRMPTDPKFEPCKTLADNVSSTNEKPKLLVCPICPTRTFIDGNALRQHQMFSGRHGHKVLGSTSGVKKNTKVITIPSLDKPENVALVKKKPRFKPRNRKKPELSTSEGGSGHCSSTPVTEVYKGTSPDRSSHSGKRKRNRSWKSPEIRGQYNHKKSKAYKFI